MFLFIFEGIGTSELLLVGLVALIFLGPRRMPEMARKLGKIMSEFRGTANEFKETWQREADMEGFQSEIKALDPSTIDAEAAQPIPRNTSITTDDMLPDSPAIKEIDPAAFDRLRAEAAEKAASAEETATEDVSPPPVSTDINDKRNWL